MQIKTSISDPIQVMRIPAGNGVIGITFCPGKKDISSRGWRWDRDLDSDLKRIVEDGWHHVVTLVEPFELEMLSVPDLGEKVSSFGLNWVHYPIIDGDKPRRGDFQALRIQLAGYLKNGQNVLVHCRGGLGRAGTVASTMLIDSGAYSPVAAIQAVRSVRPGAVETFVQENFIESLRPISHEQP